MAKFTSDWTIEHEAHLRTCFAKGMSMSDIMKSVNKEFDIGKSRNAIIGKLHRMGLRRMGENDTRPLRTGRPRKARDPGEAKVKRASAFNFNFKSVVPNGFYKAPKPTCEESWQKELDAVIEERLGGTEFNCLWPESTPCDQRAVLGPYCRAHGSMAYVRLPTAERNKKFMSGYIPTPAPYQPQPEPLGDEEFGLSQEVAGEFIEDLG